MLKSDITEKSCFPSRVSFMDWGAWKDIFNGTPDRPEVLPLADMFSIK